MRAQAFRATVAGPTRVTMPRPAFAKAPMRVSRPAQLQSQFLAPVASIKGLCATFARELRADAQRRSARSFPGRAGGQRHEPNPACAAAPQRW